MLAQVLRLISTVVVGTLVSFTASAQQFPIKLDRHEKAGQKYHLVAWSRRNTLQTLGNISLEVPDSLVQIPSDYKPIDHDRWVKLDNAKVAYGGKASKDFFVFRAPGGQLFVRVNDAPYPWDYLVRPKEATVETAFQGLIVTRSGEYIWQTKESQGFSQTYYRTARPPSEWEKEEDRRVIVKPNSVTFRSTDYKKDKAMIEVRW